MSRTLFIILATIVFIAWVAPIAGFVWGWHPPRLGTPEPVLAPDRLTGQ